MSEVWKNLIEVKIECNNDELFKIVGVCDKIFSGDFLEVDVDFNKVMLWVKYDYFNFLFKNRILCFVCMYFLNFVVVLLVIDLLLLELIF